MAHLSLRWFLLVAFSIVTAIPLTYLGWTQVVRWRDVQRRDADKELRFAAEALAQSVGQAIDREVRAQEATAEQIALRGSMEPAVVTEALHVHRLHAPECDGANFINVAGWSIAAEPDEGVVGTNYAQRPHVQRAIATGHTSVGTVELGKVMRAPYLHVAVPVHARGDGEHEGPVVACFSCAIGIAHWRELTARVVVAYGDVEARLLDRTNRLILDSDPHGRPTLTDLSAVPIYLNAAAGKASLRDGTNEQGQLVRAAVARVTERDLDWTVVVTRPRWKIEEQAHRALTTTLGAVLAALVLGLVGALLVSSWMARPFRRLADYATAVAAGAVVSRPRSMRFEPRESIALVETVAAMVVQLRKQADELRARQAEQLVLARFKKERELAQRIQSGILPKRLQVPGFEVAGLMRPAEDVSGDYYELIPTPAGCWVAIGDACGHGLDAGLLMLMVQSAIGVLAVGRRDAGPVELLTAVNALLLENIRTRMGGDDFVTLVLARLALDGQFVFAGAHEPIVVYRQATGVCEQIETPGVWMGMGPIDQGSLPEGHGRLAPDDVLVLYSDGVVERGAAQQRPFGIDRLCATIEQLKGRPAQTICEEILRAAHEWIEREPEDDMTVLVIRYIGEGRG